MVLFSLFFVAPAHADVAAAPCELVEVASTLPADGAVDVAIDSLPGVLFRGDCDGPTTWTLEVWSGEERIAQDVVEFSFAPATTYARIDAGELSPLTEYELRVIPDWGTESSVAFTTGEGQTAALSDVAVVGEGSATVDAFDGAYTIWGWAAVTPATDSTGLGLVHLTHDDVIVSSGSAAHASSLQLPSTWTEGDVPAEYCFNVTQEDGAGRFTDAEVLCVDVDVLSGGAQQPWRCNTVGGGGASFLVTLFAALAFRRRKLGTLVSLPA
jgi:hypothetical protein